MKRLAWKVSAAAAAVAVTVGCHSAEKRSDGGVGQSSPMVAQTAAAPATGGGNGVTPAGYRSAAPAAMPARTTGGLPVGNCFT